MGHLTEQKGDLLARVKRIAGQVSAVERGLERDANCADILHLVAAVRGGLLTLEEACNRYTLTVEEFLSWQKAIDQFGLPGLRATRVQQYR